jgi:hypothetical protein
VYTFKWPYTSSGATARLLLAPAKSNVTMQAELPTMVHLNLLFMREDLLGAISSI